MTFFSLRFDWLCLHRRSVQGLERLWKPTPAIRSQQQSVKRRRWTLLTVTICLHVLLWSSVIPLITMIALFAAQKIDTTVLPSTVLTIVSAVASISYIVLHSIVARRQNKLQHGPVSGKFENACYVSIRLAVTLCILWLLTSGWNFIIAARQPVCLSESSPISANDSWKVGSSCAAERFSAAISFIALVASCTLFAILAVVRRPFEAGLLGPSSSASPKYQDHYTSYYRGRKLCHSEDGVYNPALQHLHPSTSTLTSLTASSFFLPDTAMAEERNSNNGIAASLLSTPGPSFPSTPSTGDAGAHRFSWVPSPRPGSSSSSNDLGISSKPPALAAAAALLPAAPIPALTTSSMMTPALGSPLRQPIRPRRVSSADSVIQPAVSSSLQYTPAHHPRQAYQRRSRSYGQAPSPFPMASGALPTTPPRPARSPPPVDSAWRAVHPHPPINAAVGTTIGVSTAAARMSMLTVPKARARPPSMPQFSPPQQQFLHRSLAGETAAGTGAGVALTTAALASLTAAQQQPSPPTQQQQQQPHVRRAYHRHTRTLTPSGPPPALPPSVRPVVSDAASPSSGGAHNARPCTPVQQIMPAHDPYAYPALAPSPALLSLQQRAARQRPLGLRPRRSFGNGGGPSAFCGASQYSVSSSSQGTMRSSSSPLSTMVMACEVDVEALREGMKVAEGVRRSVLGDEGDVRRGLEVVEQVRGVERSGRWCRVRRGWGVGDGGKKKRGSMVREETEGDVGVEGRNWVRNASGEESVSEGEGGAVVAREREDSGVELEVTACGESSAESSSGSSENRRSNLSEKSRGFLLPSWNGYLVPKAASSATSQQSFLEAVLAAGKVTPLLLQQHQLDGGEQCLMSASSPGNDGAAPAGCVDGISRGGTIVVRRARSLEELQQQLSGKTTAGMSQEDQGDIAGVGLGLSWLIGVGAGDEQAAQDGKSTTQETDQGAKERLLEMRRVPRTRRQTVGLG